MWLRSERQRTDGKQFSNQEWYERRGYQRYHYVEKLFSKTDDTGKEWFFNAVFLKKEI
jgi:hypothetical protein